MGIGTFQQGGEIEKPVDDQTGVQRVNQRNAREEQIVQIVGDAFAFVEEGWEDGHVRSVVDVKCGYG